VQESAGVEPTGQVGEAAPPYSPFSSPCLVCGSSAPPVVTSADRETQIRKRG
jgi:hypothetical protein